MTVSERNHALQAERELGVSLDAYAGQWVAVLGHEVVLSAQTLGELLEQISSHEGFEQAEVIQVPLEKAAACFY
jgi:hypothetical protein